MSKKHELFRRKSLGTIRFGSGHGVLVGLDAAGPQRRPQPRGRVLQMQGSGNSLSMVLFAQKVLRRVTGNWTFVVVTDRAELDDQIARTFKETGAVSEADS